MTPHQAILAFELRRQKLDLDDIRGEVKCGSSELSALFKGSTPTIEVPRYMTPIFIRQSVLTIMRKYRSENDAND